MIKMTKKVIMGSLLMVFAHGQESLFWEIADPIVNSEFIESYINRLIEVESLKRIAFRLPSRSLFKWMFKIARSN